MTEVKKFLLKRLQEEDSISYYLLKESHNPSEAIMMNSSSFPNSTLFTSGVASNQTPSILSLWPQRNLQPINKLQTGILLNMLLSLITVENKTSCEETSNTTIFQVITDSTTTWLKTNTWLSKALLTSVQKLESTVCL